MAMVRLQIGPTNRGQRLSLADFQEAEWQEGYLYELAQGILVVTKVPKGKHAKIVDNTHESFSTYRRAHPRQIYLIGHGSDARSVSTVFESDRHPDLAILFRQAPQDHEGMPLPVLGVEVVLKGRRARRRDYVEKREGYLTIGLLEYWIVDPEERLVMVLVLREFDGAAGWEERVFRDADVILSELLPGYAGTVANLWADLDEEA